MIRVQKRLALVAGLVVVGALLTACGAADTVTGVGSTPTIPASCEAGTTPTGDGMPGAAQACTNDVAASGTAQTVTIDARDLLFDPPELHLKAGAPVVLELVNDGALLHDITIEGINVTDDVVEPPAEHHQGHSMTMMKPATVHLAAESGESVSATFTPRAGTFEFYCSVAGHREAGMHGTIVVE